MPYKDPEVRKQKAKERSRAYYLANREKVLARSKEKAEERKEYFREYARSERGRKSNRIACWKRWGIKCEDWDSLHTKFMECEKCEECEREFGTWKDGTRSDKCLDHDHETGLFRNILCRDCNIKRGK